MIRDNSYKTVRYGLVRSYAGYEVLGEPGSRVLRVGYPPLGTADTLTRQGGVVELRETDLGTREFELRVLDRRYSEGEISYAEYVRSMRTLIKTETVRGANAMSERHHGCAAPDEAQTQEDET